MRKLLVAYCLLVAAPLAADQESAAIVPDAERSIVQELGVEGPTETTGIGDSKVLAAIDLGTEFRAMEGRSMRARVVTLLPGGTVAVHQHHSRPGIAYVLAGEVVEHRNDASEPLLRRAGDAAVEKTGTIHWWKNESDRPAKVLVVDIVSADR